ncbi:hypothetical protein AK812_SmicGene15177 [Symbiodinium microadriaticum]|uniref:Uncharacterized protein n=1 Tax=Symbiodinium microadriaticum TaxID=2951 RepID=A0A1Q9E3M1_SYMMI|nr:hypothetical protein AK812_SmicGene15177 [Symbiodinium microadriaticum]
MAQASFAYCDDPLQTDKAALIQGARFDASSLGPEYSTPGESTVTVRIDASQWRPSLKAVKGANIAKLSVNGEFEVGLSAISAELGVDSTQTAKVTLKSERDFSISMADERYRKVSLMSQRDINISLTDEFYTEVTALGRFDAVLSTGRSRPDRRPGLQIQKTGLDVNVGCQFVEDDTTMGEITFTGVLRVDETVEYRANGDVAVKGSVKLTGRVTVQMSYPAAFWSSTAEPVIVDSCRETDESHSKVKQ